MEFGEWSVEMNWPGHSFSILHFQFSIIAHAKKRTSVLKVLDGIRRRPTLPGRFQPSTISVLRLNFCVRDGNRWIPQAIVTGIRRCPNPIAAARPLARQSAVDHGHLTAFVRPRSGFCAFALFAPSKLHRMGFRFHLTKVSASSF